MIFSRLRDELCSFGKSEKIFIFFSMFACFLIASEYAITRPASHALFLTYYSAKMFPWVWVATVPLNLSVIYLYNRFLPLWGPVRMLVTLGAATICINSLAGLLLPHFPGLVFLHFAWKDIYILLMFKQLWSMIHSTIAPSRAKYLYGIIFGTGTLGSVAASFVPGLFAVQIGSESLFFFTLPIYALMMFAYWSAFKKSQMPKESFGKSLTPNPEASEGLALIRRNKFLAAVLLLVVCMQVSVGLMEYQFNSHLEMNILEKDLRTAYVGRLIGITNILSGLFQIVGGFLMVQAVGLRGSHLAIPAALLASALLSWAMPSFALISLSFVFIKAIDFSLFGVVREMLYVPLKLDEKFRAKAIIDVFAYRTSKALVSGILLALQFAAGAFLLQAASYISIAVFLAWIRIVYWMFRKAAPASISST